MNRLGHGLLLGLVVLPAGLFTGAFLAGLVSPRAAAVASSVLTDQPALIANTLRYGILTALVATVLGWLLAHLQYNYSVPGRQLLHVFTLSPILLPSFTFAMGLVMLFGNSGLVTRAAGISGGSVYGLTGLIVAGAWARIPFAYLLLSAVYRTIDSRVIETAADLGAGSLRILRWVLLPRVGPVLVATICVLTAETVTDLAVPLVLGGDFGTLAGRVFDEASSEGDLSTACAYAVWLLPMAFALRPLARRFAPRPNMEPTHGKPANRRLDLFGWVLLVIGWLVVGLTIVLLLVVLVGAFVTSFGVVGQPTLAHFADLFAGSQTRALATTVLLALVSVPLVVLGSLGLVRAAVTRPSRHTQRLLETIAAIPGMVLGLGALTIYVAVSNVLRDAGFSSTFIAWGAAVAIVLVYLARFIPMTSLPLLTTTAAATDHLRDTALNLGAEPGQVARLVLLPNLRPELVSGTLIALARTLTSISSVIWLVNAQVPLLSVRMLTDVDAGQLSAAAAMNVALAALIAVAALVSWSLTTSRSRWAR